MSNTAPADELSMVLDIICLSLARPDIGLPLADSEQVLHLISPFHASPRTINNPRFIL